MMQARETIEPLRNRGKGRYARTYVVTCDTEGCSSETVPASTMMRASAHAVVQGIDLVDVGGELRHRCRVCRRHAPQTSSAASTPRA